MQKGDETSLQFIEEGCELRFGRVWLVDVQQPVIGRARRAAIGRFFFF